MQAWLLRWASQPVKMAIIIAGRCSMSIRTRVIITHASKRKNSTTYEWNTKSGIDVEIKYMKEGLVAEGCYDIKITKRKMNKSKLDCDNFDM